MKIKFELLIGFLSLIISLSTFGDKMEKIDINLGFISFTGREYLFYSIIGLFVSFYFYAIDYTFKMTKIGKWRIFYVLTLLAYSVFVFIILSPILITLNYFAYRQFVYLFEKSNGDWSLSFFIVLIQIVWLLKIIFDVFLSIKWIEFNKKTN